MPSLYNNISIWLGFDCEKWTGLASLQIPVKKYFLNHVNLFSRLKAISPYYTCNCWQYYQGKTIFEFALENKVLNIFILAASSTKDTSIDIVSIFDQENCSKWHL